MSDISDQDKIQPQKIQPVDRKRRAIYVFAFTSAAVTSSILMAFTGQDSAIAKLVAGKLLDLAEVLAFIYVSASAFDYSVGNALKLNMKNKNVEISKD